MTGALAGPTRALLYGNFAIGCGVMVAPGSLNDLVQSLQVSLAVGGQLVAIAAAAMAAGAPLLAAAVGGLDRRRLLAACLVWYALGHALCALVPSYALLMPLRAVTVLGAAVFTPQAAAAIGHMSDPADRGRAITTIFLGWSISSVVGMPVHAYIGEAFGWRWAFALVALISFVGAVGVWRALPDGVRPPPLSLQSWRTIFTRPRLLAIPIVTALSGAGQFTLFSYFAPYYRQVLGASALETSLLFFWFGVFGLIGNIVIARAIGRYGADRPINFALVLMAVSLAVWPLALTLPAMALALLPWALGCFSSNSGQQARAGIAAPDLASGLMALNTSAIYLGQAVGAALGGVVIATSGTGMLAPAGLAWMVAAIALSFWIGARTTPSAR